METVKKAWLGERGLNAAFEKIDSEFASLRQEIQDLKTDKPEEPPTPLPPEQWEHGDVISCIHTKRKEVGIFHHIRCFTPGVITGDVMGYWPDENGMISNVISYRGLYANRVTFEFRPEK